MDKNHGYGCGTLVAILGCTVVGLCFFGLTILFIIGAQLDYATAVVRISIVALIIPLGVFFEIVNSYFTKAARYKEKKQKIEEDKKEQDLRTKFR